MKVLDTPRVGRIANQIFYPSPYGQGARQACVPRNTRTPQREHVRGGFAYYSRGWRTLLTEAGRQLWNAAGAKVPTARKLNQSGFCTGQQHWMAVNVSQFRVGEPTLWTPPDPVVFGPHPVAGLSLTNAENGVRLLLNVIGPITEKIMVFGQAPCSAGRSKRRNVSYLGLLPAPIDGLADITALYVARYGEPKPGEKVFIVTRQQKNGWESPDHVTSEIVPGQSHGREELQALQGLQRLQGANEGGARTEDVTQRSPLSRYAPAQPALPLNPHMHNGCTPGAQGYAETGVPCSPEGAKAMTKDGMANDEAKGGGAEASKSASAGGGAGERPARP
jgi:hypothetical protein